MRARCRQYRIAGRYLRGNKTILARGACFFAYFLCTSKESEAPAGAQTGKSNYTHNLLSIGSTFQRPPIIPASPRQRANKPQLHRKQLQASRIGIALAILRIAQNRTTDAGKVPTNLMFAAGIDQHFCQ